MFIVVTDTYGDKLRINVDLIEYYESSKADDVKSFIKFTNGNQKHIKESVEQLDKALQESYLYVKTIS